ncbi:MAG TPA: MFS transporter, partial [Actinomycetota bacterium]|nr:MFS transporter [Actinomycetota bacterium]
MTAAKKMTARERWIITVVILGSAIVFLDTSVVSVALPRMGRELESKIFGVLEAQSYVYNGYLLTLSALLIPAGALSDRYGRKKLFVAGLVGFGVTSLLCGLAPSMETIIVARLFQGAAGAFLVPGSLAILTNAFEGEQRGRAFGLWAAASGAGVILGPVLAGVLINSVSWRAAFLINVPLTALALYPAIRHIEESRDESMEGSVDWMGSLTAILAVGGLTFGTIRGQEQNWQQPVAFVALIIGAVASIVFPMMILKRKNPLIRPELFRSRNFTVTNISTLLIYASIYLSGYLASLFVLGTLGYNEPAAGLSGAIASLLFTALSTKFGTLAGRYGPRWFMTVGPAILGLGLLLLARVPAESTPWILDFSDPETFLPSRGYLVDFLPGFALFGLGLAIFVAPLTTALMTSVPSKSAGAASAFNNAISRVGPQLAGALIFVAITASFYSGLAERLPELNVSDDSVRRNLSPLNTPASSVSERELEAARAESVKSFRIA